MRIVLDPGHGGDGRLTTYGATGYGLKEKDLVLDIAKRVREYITRNTNATVVLTREDDKDVPWNDRTSPGSNADILFSLHFNGFHDARANGFETFIYNGTVSSVTQKYQKIIHDEIYKVLSPLGVSNRGTKKANFHMLRVPACPCVLVEYVFLTNEKDNKIFQSSSNIQEVSKATALGIIKALNIQLIEESNNLPVIQKRIPIVYEGELIGEVGYLINNGTYVRAAFIGNLAGFNITGHGDHIKIEKQR